MPRVPIPSVGLQTGSTPMLGAPGVDPMPDVAGQQAGEFGGALRQFGNSVMSAASVLQDEFNDAKVKQGFAQFEDFALGTLHDPKEGFFNKVGPDALDKNRAKVLESLEKKARDIETIFENDVQRGMFREAFAKTFKGIKQQVYGHEAEQLRVWNIGQTKSLRGTSIRSAVAAYMHKATSPEADVVAAAAETVALEKRAQDPQAMRTMRPDWVELATNWQKTRASQFELHRNTAISLANEEARLSGFPEGSAQHKQMVLQTTTELHSAVIDQLLATGRDSEAIDYYAKVDKAEIDLREQGAISRALRTATVRRRGVQVAEEAVSMSMDAARKEAGEQAPEAAVTRIAVARMMKDGVDSLAAKRRSGEIDDDTYRTSLDHLRERHSMITQQWNTEAGNAYLQAEQFLAQNRGVVSIDSPSFPTKLREQLIQYGKASEANALAAQNGIRVTDPGTYRRLLQAADNGSLVGMTREALFATYYPNLSASEWNEAQQLHALANKQQGEKGYTADEISKVEDDYLDLLSRAKVLTDFSPEGKPRPKGDDEAERLVRFREALRQRVRRAAGDKPMPAEQIIQTASRMLFDEQGRASNIYSVDVPIWSDRTELFEFEVEDVRSSYFDVGGQRVSMSQFSELEIEHAGDQIRIGLATSNDPALREKALNEIAAARLSTTNKLQQRMAVDAVLRRYGAANVEVSTQQIGTFLLEGRNKARQASTPAARPQDRPTGIDRSWRDNIK